MRATSYFCFLVLCLSSLAAGCGDSGGGGGKDGGDRDGGDTYACPAEGPNAGDLEQPCCYRKSNADRQDAPEFRVTGLAIDSLPNTLGVSVVDKLIQDTLDKETFNWLIQIAGADGASVTARTGFGVRNDDDTYNFAVGIATGPGDENRWDPIDADAELNGETLSFTYGGDWVLPVGSPEMPLVELPLSGVVVDRMVMTEERTCVGRRINKDFDRGDGSLTTYITVDAAKAFDVPDPINDNFCNFIAGADCGEVDQGEWESPPDSLCGDDGCEFGECDATACNAWQVKGSFSAAGVEIEEGASENDGGVDAGE